MKKLFTLLIVFQVIIISARSQIQNGNLLVGADVALLARGSEALAARFVGVEDPGRAGY